MFSQANYNTAAPAALEVLPNTIADELKAIPQWLCWDWAFRNMRWTKPPLDAKTGGAGSHSNPATWALFSVAMEYMQRHRLPGIGLALTADLGIVGADLDKCRDPQTGTIAPWAQAIIAQWSSYTNISPSETGIRIFGYGQLPEDGKRRGPIEIYRAKRYLTVTGHRIPGTPGTLQPAQAAIDALYRQVAGEIAQRDAHGPRVWTTPCTLPSSDLRARAASGRIKRTTLALLDSPGRPGDSEVDMHLACGLVGAGLTADEALALVLGSVRGQTTADRKGNRYVESYWRRTVENAARHVGPVVPLAGLRMRFGDAGAALCRMGGRQ
jgi:hypothetical protein